MPQETQMNESPHALAANKRFTEFKHALHRCYELFDIALLVLSLSGLGITILFLKNIEKPTPNLLLGLLAASTFCFIITLSLTLFSCLKSQQCLEKYIEYMREDFLDQKKKLQYERYCLATRYRRTKILTLLSLILGIVFLFGFLFAHINLKSFASVGLQNILTTMSKVELRLGEIEKKLGDTDGVVPTMTKVESRLGEIEKKLGDTDGVVRSITRSVVKQLFVDKIREIPSFLKEPLEGISPFELISRIVNLHALYKMLFGEDITVVAEEVKALESKFEGELSRRIYEAARGGAGDAVRMEMFIQKALGRYYPLREHLYNVYFNFDSAKLSPGAIDQINRPLQDHQPEAIEGIELEAYADTVGGTKYNIDLSRRRGEAVRDKLFVDGFTQVPIRIYAHGEKEAPQATGDGVAEPLNRLVKITVLSRVK